MVTISFSKNEAPATQAYQLNSHLLGLNSLFPHVSSKNMALHVNFGFIVSVFLPNVTSMSFNYGVACDLAVVT